MARRLLLVLLALSPVWLPCWTMPAHAQDAEEIEQARSDFQRAVELEQAGDFAGALRLFRRVGQVKMTPQVRYHIAACEENLGKMVAALGGYRLALQGAEGMHPGFVEEVERSIEYLEQRIPKLVVERGQGADAAAISLDGVGLGAKLVGTEIPLDPGPHTVSATAPGYQDFSVTVTMTEGQTQELSIELEAVVSEPEPELARPAPATPEEPPAGFGVAPFVTAGAGGAVFIAGAVFLGVAGGKAGAVQDLCGGTDCTGLSGADLDRAQELNQQAHGMQTTGLVLMGIGVVGIATGTILYFTDPARRAARNEAARLRFDLSAPRADLGLSLGATF